jgi:hypothetical protein
MNQRSHAIHAFPITQQALSALTTAIRQPPRAQGLLVEERNVWQPESWLLQRCWEALADAGAHEEALYVAGLAQTRQPTSPLHALYRLARSAAERPRLALAINDELARRQTTFLQHHPAGADPLAVESYLLLAAASARVGNHALACACLERLDQLAKPWATILGRADLRALLAETAAHIGLHPLVTSLLTTAIRRYDDAGAHFLHETAACAHALGERAPQRSQRLLQYCIDTFRFTSLTSLHCRRLAAATFGFAGLVDEVLEQLAFITNVQSARREAGLSPYRDDPLLLRQVKRPTANSDIDFQVYTLQQAVAVMPLRTLPREKRILLADQLAELGRRSDGWTAAGASATLIALGALKYAVEVVNQIAAQDPTRSEGMLSLVRGLLDAGEHQLAAEQAQRALMWARARHERNPERAITWGLAEIYLEHHQPTQALRWLEQWREPHGWRHQLTSWWQKTLDDDAFRLRSLRLRALLQAASTPASISQPRQSKEREALLNELRRWAPRLLEGEALVHFYIHSLLRPLLAANQLPLAWGILPELTSALNVTSGNKHATQVAEVATLLAHQLRLDAVVTLQRDKSAPPVTQTSDVGLALRTHFETFLANLWQLDAKRGPWQIVHGIEGAIPLLLMLEGSQAVVALARAVYEQSCSAT